jgi:transcriptional regulator with XRE-family HTH domain
MVDLAELGRRIRKLRSERRQTLKQVEEASGLSSTHLSEIERGRTSPTIGALVRIARALDRDASYFIEPDERPEVCYLAREQRRAVPGAVQAESLTTGVPGSHVYTYRITLLPGARQGLTLEAQDMPGEATYYVQRGEVATRVGSQTRRLAAGDALQASLRRPHELRAAGSEPAELIAILTRALEPAQS